MIPLFEPVLDEEDVETVVTTIRSGWLIERSRTREFEKAFAEYVGTRYTVATTSGTVALFLALKASGLKWGGKVAVPDFTALGTIRAVQLAGGHPILFDVDDYGNIDVGAVCKSGVGRVIVVHNNGHPCDLSRLIEHLGKRYVIEDACQSLGSKLNGRQIGTDADLGCFSLSTTKIITAGQGGVVVTDDEELYTLIQRLKNQGNFRGVDPPDTYVGEGYNFTWTDMNAALALSQMAKLGKRVLRMNEINKLYFSRIGKYMPKREIGEVPWRITVQVSAKARDKVVLHMRENGVGARAFFRPLHTHFGFKGLPNATSYASKGICLPSSPSLKEEEVDYICDKLLEVLE